MVFAWILVVCENQDGSEYEKGCLTCISCMCCCFCCCAWSYPSDLMREDHQEEQIEMPNLVIAAPYSAPGELDASAPPMQIEGEPHTYAV